MELARRHPTTTTADVEIGPYRATNCGARDVDQLRRTTNGAPKSDPDRAAAERWLTTLAAGSPSGGAAQSLFDQPYSAVYTTPARESTSWARRARLFLLGRPFRRRHTDETDREYRLAQLARLYEQRGRALLVLLALLFAGVVCYFVYGVRAGTIGVALGEPPYGAETMAARRALGEEQRALFRVLTMPCSASATADGALRPSAAVDYRAYTDDRTAADQAHVLRAHRAVTKAIAAWRPTDPPCVCAPQTGHFLRVLALVNSTSGDAARPLILFNPSIADAAGNLDRVVRHSQAALFDTDGARFVDATSDVYVVRRSVLDVEASGGLSVRIEGEHAYCAAECIDLLEGYTIWDRALLQARSGIDVNERVVLAAVEARLACRPVLAFAPRKQ